ncbi:unnamed protein product [Symbiodinium sp. CCMP2592]|nr:unnamed protein product [Symbiodinium sp. CCMP2592]
MSPDLWGFAAVTTPSCCLHHEHPSPSLQNRQQRKKQRPLPLAYGKLGHKTSHGLRRQIPTQTLRTPYGVWLMDQEGQEPDEEDDANSVSVASLTEDEVAAALREYRGILTRKMLKKARRSRAKAKSEEAQAAEQSGPSRRRFYAMTSDRLGNEKALDGSWIDKLQELLDDTADAYGARTEWQAEVHAAEQKELRDQIGGYLGNFFQVGSDSIDAVTGHLVQVWRSLNTPMEASGALEPRDAAPDMDIAMREVVQSLKEARDIGSSRANKMSHQWFAYLTKEVFKVEQFGEHQRIQSLEQLKSRLRLHHAYEDLTDRWDRMDNLNMGLEEAVNNKAILGQAVEHAESLLNQQVEADFHKTFQKETKQLLLQAAKARADLVGQVENVVRHRGVLRSELLMHLGEFNDKLKAWHVRASKKFQEGILELKSARRQAENRKKTADSTLQTIKAQVQSIQSELSQMLSPYTGSQMDIEVDFSTFEIISCPAKDVMVSRILQTVADREDAIVPSLVLSAVKDLVNRSPIERLQKSTAALVPEHSLWQDRARVREVLNFAGVQAQLRHRAAATSDIARFLVENKGLMLLRGPDRPFLEEIIKDLRSITSERTFGYNATAAAKLLKKAENLLKVLSAANCRGSDFRRGCVGAEASLVMGLLQFGGLVRAQRGCKLLAALYSLRSLQLRKQALGTAMEVPASRPVWDQVRAIEAALRAVDGSLNILAEQAKKLAQDGSTISSGYSHALEQLLEVTQQLATNRRIDVWTSKGVSQEKIDAAGTETNAEGKSVEIDLFPDLPALLAAGPQAKQSHGSPGCDAGQMALHALKHQQAMLKMHFKLRKWLHCALLPNLSERDFEKTQEAVEASQAYLQGQLPADEADSVSSSRSSESSEDSAPLSSPRTQRSSTLGAVSPLQSMTPGIEQVDDDHRGSMNDLLRQRSVSDMLHDRRFDANLSQRMSERFAANADSYKEALYESSHETDLASSSEEQVLPYEVLQQRSQATFLRWASSAPPKAAAKPRAKARGGIKHGSNWALKATAGEASSSSPSPKSGLAKFSPRVYRDLAGRQVAQTSSRPTSGVSGASMPGRLGGHEAEAGVASDSDADTSRYTGQNSSPELTPRRQRMLVADQADPDIREMKETEELETVAGEVHDRQEHHVRHSLRHKPRLVQESVDASSLVLATSSTARGRTHQYPQPGKPRSQSPKSTSPPPVPLHSMPDLRPPLPDLRPGAMQTGLHVAAAEVGSSAGDEPNLQSTPSAPVTFTLEELGEPETVHPTTAPPTEFTAEPGKFNKQTMMRAFSTKHQTTEDDLPMELDDVEEAETASLNTERVQSGDIAMGSMDRPVERAEEAPAGAEAASGICEDGNRSVDGSEALEDEIAETETSKAGPLHSGRMHHASLENMENMESIDPGIDPQPELLHSQSGSYTNVAPPSLARPRPRTSEKAPRHGRAFPPGCAEADRALTGPPGTARRLQLHSRPASASKPRPARPEAVTEETERGWLPWPESLASRFLPESERNDERTPTSAIETAYFAPVHVDVKTVSKQAMIVKQLQLEPPSADSQQPQQPSPVQPQKPQQPQRLPQHPMQRQRSGEGKEVPQKATDESAEALPVQIAKPCIFNRASTPEIGRLISDGAGSEPPVLPYSDSSCTEEVSVHESGGSFPEAQNMLQNGSQAHPRCEVGPIRKGLPMTRRGVAQLLKQHEVAPDELSLCGEAVKPSKTQRRPATASSKEVQMHHVHSDPSPQVPGTMMHIRIPISAELLSNALAGERPRRLSSSSPKNVTTLRHSVSAVKHDPHEECIYDEGMPVAREDSFALCDSPSTTPLEFTPTFHGPRRTRTMTKDDSPYSPADADGPEGVSFHLDSALGTDADTSNLNSRVVTATDSIETASFIRPPSQKVAGMLMRSRYAPMLSIQTVSISDHMNRSKPSEEMTTALPQHNHRNESHPRPAPNVAAGRNVRAADPRQWEGWQLRPPSLLPSAPVAMATVPEHAEESLRSWRVNRPSSASAQPKVRPKTPRLL